MRKRSHLSIILAIPNQPQEIINDMLLQNAYQLLCLLRGRYNGTTTGPLNQQIIYSEKNTSVTKRLSVCSEFAGQWQRDVTLPSCSCPASIQ